MGIGFVFLAYLFLLAIVTVPAILIGGTIGYFVARKEGNRKRRLFVLVGALLPIAGAVYIVGCIVFMAIVGLATGRDAGFGDSFDLPLNNHYQWSAIDTTDSAMIYDSNDKSAADGGSIHIEQDNRNAFDNVLQLQEDGDWLAGAYCSQDGRFDNPSRKQEPDHWFLFNTRTHQRIDAADEAELKSDAATKGMALQLQSSDFFYTSHRFWWFDLTIGILLLIPPFVVLVFVWGKGRALLRSA